MEKNEIGNILEMNTQINSGRLISKGHKPSKILADIGPQFRDIFENGCKKLKIEVEHTPKHYSQSKGKVERCIQTFKEEFLRLGSVFDRVDGLLPQFVRWYNFDRLHMGLGCVPACYISIVKMLPMSLDITNRKII